MTTLQTCRIKILNKTYDIKCPPEETENLKAAANKLDEQLMESKKKFNNLDAYQILLLSALTISHELMVSQKQQEEQRQQVAQFISSLESKINHVVQGNSSFSVSPQ